jgi:hypothetical protein
VRVVVATSRFLTLAVASHAPIQPPVPQTVPVVILGTDAVLAASPATPVQLAHACLRAGFANVVPASWGDELIAGAMLHRLQRFGNGPAIQCSCPIVAHRLLTVGGDLRPVMVPLVSPPVAIARYVRAITRPARARITYVGACPGAVDEAIDIRMTPEALFAMLAERDIVVAEQPRVFEATTPADRRRYHSQPGGLPTAEALWSAQGSRTLVEIEGDDFVTEVVQHLLSGKNILIDASMRLGCACSGAVQGAHQPRAQVVALEPPRATSSVIEEAPPIELDLPIPAVPRVPIDVVAMAPTPLATLAATAPHRTETVAVHPGPTGANGAPPEQPALPAPTPTLLSVGEAMRLTRERPASVAARSGTEPLTSSLTSGERSIKPPAPALSWKRLAVAALTVLAIAISASAVVSYVYGRLFNGTTTSSSR